MQKKDVYKSIEEMRNTPSNSVEMVLQITGMDIERLKKALQLTGDTDDKMLGYLFACYCKLLAYGSKTVYVEKGISQERYRETLLRAIRAENEVEALKRQIAGMGQPDNLPHYNLAKGDKIAYKSSVCKEDIIKLMNMGLTQTEIADRLQVSRSTISRRLRE